MPVISFISPKGGVGKTTSTVMLAIQLANSAPVIVIDADPNEPVKAWSKLPNFPANITVVSDVTQDNIMDKIEAASNEAGFVLVDCEGTASVTVVYAVGLSDLVIVPTQGSQLDARQAGRALSIVQRAEKQTRRAIPMRVLFTRTNPTIRTKNLDNVQKQLRGAGVLMFDTHLNEREAFRGPFTFGGALETLSATDVSNVPKAIANARAFRDEVVAVLRDAARGAAA